ncbi:shikimate kinase [Paenibacillus marinisediminis]
MLTEARAFNIVLIGFMGTGKSTVGECLADRLKYDFVDLDEEIVRMEGRSIPDIFAQDGEAYFRDAESLALSRLMGQQRLVIATGGGAVLREKNCRVMSECGYVVHLTAETDTIIERVRGDRNRPLLQGDASERVRSLMVERSGKYDFAHATVATDHLRVEQIADAVMDAYQGFNSADADITR